MAKATNKPTEPKYVWSVELECHYDTESPPERQFRVVIGPNDGQVVARACERSVKSQNKSIYRFVRMVSLGRGDQVSLSL